MFGGVPFSPTVDLGFVGVAPADAKAFYTRKRVKGRWITGRFAKRHATKTASGNRAGSRHMGEGAFAYTVARAPRTAALAPEETDLRAPGRQVMTIAQVSPAEPPGNVLESPGATTAPLVPLSEDERLSKLREGLRARASTLTTGTLASPPSAPETQSVSLDFVSGTKTTTFSDGTFIREPFDVGALKGLAASPPQAKPPVE
jgi:hypothetical protein